MKTYNVDVFVGNVDKFYDVTILKTDTRDNIKYTYFKNSTNENS